MVTSLRDTVRDALTEGLDERYTVYGYPRSPDVVMPADRPVCVWTDSYTRGKTFRTVGVTVVVWVLSSLTDETEAVEDDLEDAASDVLGVLDTATAAGQVFVWTSATRAVLEDTWHGYRIELSAVGTITPETTP